MSEDNKQEAKPVAKTANTNRQKNGTFGPKNNANPNGRPKGKTITEGIRKFLEENPEEMQKVIKYFVQTERKLMWQMLEGRPPQDITTKGKELPTPILKLDALQSDDSND